MRHKVFVINLEERTERREHILTEFSAYPEFEVTLVPAKRHEVGAWGLWQTIREVVKLAKRREYEYIILCEDDHMFTDAYNCHILNKQINKLQIEGADVLVGGASWFETVVQVSTDLFWVKKFNGLQFVVIYRRFYERVLDLPMKVGDNVDIVMSLSTENSFLCYPYISAQREFGYSDVTSRNAEEGYITHIFACCMEKLRQLDKVARHYDTLK